MALDCIIAQLLMIHLLSTCFGSSVVESEVTGHGQLPYIFVASKYMVKVSTNNNITNPSQHPSIPITKIKRVLFGNKVIIYI